MKNPMYTEARIDSLNKIILETKMKDPGNFEKIRKLQLELDRLYEISKPK